MVFIASILFLFVEHLHEKASFTENEGSHENGSKGA